jgi:hypothetical protein
MAEELRFNLVDFPSSYICNSDVMDLPERLARNVSSQLIYSCKFWSFHLEKCKSKNEILGYIKDFIEKKLLYWIELCSLLGEISKAQLSLQKLFDWTKVSIYV